MTVYASTCAACHALMDPFGFALEPFDAVGHYRTLDGTSPINDSVTMYDGTNLEGPTQLRNWVLKYKDRYVTNLTEKLVTYALGRGVEYYDDPTIRSSGLLSSASPPCALHFTGSPRTLPLWARSTTCGSAKPPAGKS